MDDFLRGYVECALWSTNDESTPSGGVPLDSKYGIEDIDPRTLERMRADCERFQEENAESLALYCERVTVTDGSSAESYAGHDFWLTRNHHGAGFWDRGVGPVGDALTASTDAWGECYLYVGDDGKIHI